MIVKLWVPVLELLTVLCLSAGSFLFYPGSDALTIKAVGSNNKIVIDSVLFTPLLIDSLLHPVNGEIIQTGEKNRVEINTSDSNAKNKAKHND